jgi:hypothetical protein
VRDPEPRRNQDLLRAALEDPEGIKLAEAILTRKRILDKIRDERDV